MILSRSRDQFKAEGEALRRKSAVLTRLFALLIVFTSFGLALAPAKKKRSAKRTPARTVAVAFAAKSTATAKPATAKSAADRKSVV